MVKNIIFDFGGVIYDIDHLKTKEAFDVLGLTNFEELYGHAVQTRLFEEFEIGKISPADFRETIRKYIPLSTTDIAIDTAWNALLIGFDLQRLELLYKIKKHYRLFLLSNTNQIHYQHYMAQLEELKQKHSFLNSFEKLYFSHQIGMRKPDLIIFNCVLAENSLLPAETIFIDDYDANIKEANTVGLKGLHLEPGKDLHDLFTTDGQLKT